MKLGSVSKNFKITIGRTVFGFEVEKYFFSFQAISALFLEKNIIFLKLPGLARSVPKPLNQQSLRSVAKLMKPASKAASQLATSQRVGGQQRHSWHQPS